MISVAAVRTVTLVICVAGIAGMIVTSILNHNGAAVTFGLITAVAVLCSIVAKAVAADTTQRLSRLGGPAPEPGIATMSGSAGSGPGSARSGPGGSGPDEHGPGGSGPDEHGPGGSGPDEPGPEPGPEPGGTRLGGAPGRAAAAPDAEALAELVEGQVQAMVAAGADESTVRQLVGEAVRLGRNLALIHGIEASH